MRDKIIQVISVRSEYSDGDTIWGLSENGNLYILNNSKWEPQMQSPDMHSVFTSSSEGGE